MKKIALEKKYIALFIATFIYVGFGVCMISSPGVYYDELFWLNASLGNINGVFIAKSIGKIPLFVMDYIGALKSWIYAVPFAVLGTSVLTLRFMELILGCIALITTWLSVKKIGFREANIIVLLLSVDSIFVFTTRMDWGPVTIMMIMKGLALYFFVNYIINNNIKDLFLVGLTLFVGLFDKANFSWVFVAFLISAIAVYGTELLCNYKKQKKVLYVYVGWGTIYLIVGVVYLLPLFMGDTTNQISVIEHISRTWQVVINTLNGTGLFSFFFVGNEPQKSLLLIFVVITTLESTILGIYMIITKKLTYKMKFLLFIIMYFSITLICILITKSAGGVHHTASLWPLPEVIVVLGISVNKEFLTEKIDNYKQVIKYSCNGIVIVLAISMVINFWTYESAQVEEKTSMLWSTSIYDLAQFIDRENPDSIICGDWGFGNQLLLLLSKENKYKVHDAMWQFMEGDEEQQKWFREEFVGNKRTFIVCHEDGIETLSSNGDIERFCYNTDVNAEIQYIKEKSGKVIYKIYMLNK